MSDIAVIIATYRRPDALRVVLDSLETQTHSDFSVTIADDGSGEETRSVIESFEANSSVQTRHVWQPDDGPRKSAALNRAIAATDAGYVIFIDGDCIVRRDFVAMHVRLAERGRFVRGSRVRIGESLTGQILSQGLRAHEWSRASWLAHRLGGRIDRVSPLLRLPLGPVRRIGGQKWKGVKGCNLAVWREDLLAVGGFDESIPGPGPEDVDLALRLIRHGVRRKEARYAAPVLHLWHPQRAPDGPGQALFEQRLRSDTTHAAVGVEQYL